MNFSRKIMRGLSVIVMTCGLALAGGCMMQESFNTSQEAVDSLVSALRAQDQSQIKKILGPQTDALLSSGDQVSDRNRRTAFLAEYDKKHALEEAEDGSTVVVVGDSDWPMPIPLTRSPWDKKWYFDVSAGKEEMLNRRIGRNELDAMQTCLAIVDAQRDYAKMDPERAGGGRPIYAGQFMSTPGQKNGLYWESKESEPVSPLGELVAEATNEGYTFTAGHRTPYHGYYYRILKAQGRFAPGGAKDYVVDGRMTGGFALVAYPAEYGRSGIMTFMVNADGILYSRDLGLFTENTASEMTVFDPGPAWKAVKNDQITIVPQ